jgi:hypothetical protein
MANGQENPKWGNPIKSIWIINKSTLIGFLIGFPEAPANGRSTAGHMAFEAAHRPPAIF